MSQTFTNAFDQFLARQCTPQRVRDIEANGDAVSLWQEIEKVGFADALVSEVNGGAGLSLRDVFGLFELCGLYALPVPLAETMLARAFIGNAGVIRPTGSIAIAHGRVEIDGSIICATVRAGRTAQQILAVVDGQCLLLKTAQASSCVAGFTLDATFTWPAAEATFAKCIPGIFDVRLVQGCIYAAMISGALLRVFNMTLRYANDRIQFGRPIGKFQAIQHHLADMSEHVAAARMAAQIGCLSATAHPNRLQVAVAKARTSEAALQVANLGHAIHGAIGFTEEFDLQLFTRRLHVWRQAGGSESYWHDIGGGELVDRNTGSALDLIRTTLVVS